jgi:hypothetical protein
MFACVRKEADIFKIIYYVFPSFDLQILMEIEERNSENAVIRIFHWFCVNQCTICSHYFIWTLHKECVKLFGPFCILKTHYLSDCTHLRNTNILRKMDILYQQLLK